MSFHWSQPRHGMYGSINRECYMIKDIEKAESLERIKMEEEERFNVLNFIFHEPLSLWVMR